LQVADLQRGALVLYDPDSPDLNEFGWENFLLKMPDTLVPEQAALVPHLMLAMRLWDGLELEIGESALVTGSSTFSRVLCHVAFLQGAWPILLNDKPLDLNKEVQEIVLNRDDPESTEAALNKALTNRPSFVAIEASGQAMLVDLLLEVLPNWGRLMFCHSATEPLTLDYYRNIHLKGAAILTTLLDSKWIFETNKDIMSRELMERAVRLASSIDIENLHLIR
jgi:NADPH:quinone reductase-like Zn-dependent oxidoreductase